MVEWIDARPVAGEIIEVKTGVKYEVLDYRNHLNPETMLEKVLSDYPTAIIWAEGQNAGKRQKSL